MDLIRGNTAYDWMAVAIRQMEDTESFRVRTFNGKLLFVQYADDNWYWVEIGDTASRKGLSSSCYLARTTGTLHLGGISISGIEWITFDGPMDLRDEDGQHDEEQEEEDDA